MNSSRNCGSYLFQTLPTKAHAVPWVAFTTWPKKRAGHTSEAAGKFEPALEHHERGVQVMNALRSILVCLSCIKRSRINFQQLVGIGLTN